MPLATILGHHVLMRLLRAVACTTALMVQLMCRIYQRTTVLMACLDLARAGAICTSDENTRDWNAINVWWI